MNVDVVVVGAGVAGLVAADRLVAEGRSVVVLEARDRVGGRTWTVDVPEVPGLRVDAGGQWVGPQQHALLAELQRFGLQTVVQSPRGEAVVRMRGRSARYSGQTPRLDPLTLADVGQAMLRFNAAARRIDLAAPWTSPRADRLDAQTFESWIRRTSRTPKGRDFFRIACEAVFATEASNVSLLHALFYASSGTSLEHLLATAGGAQHARVAGGMQQLAEALASELGPWVRLEEPVEAVVQDGDHVAVLSASGATTAERVIVTVPPALAGSIDYQPALPAARVQLMQRMPHGAVIKLHAVYESPFWHADGLSGDVVSDEPPVKVVFDATAPDADAPGVLIAFIEGADALTHSAGAPAIRRAAVLAALARYVGPRALNPIAFVEQDWTTQEWTRGCYGAHLPPGAWTQVGHTLRTPAGPVHWAGTETAERWCGYVDGAISSGERAAREVDDALDRARP